jgi:hypothetical protein
VLAIRVGTWWCPFVQFPSGLGEFVLDGDWITVETITQTDGSQLIVVRRYPSTVEEVTYIVRTGCVRWIINGEFIDRLCSVVVLRTDAEQHNSQWSYSWSRAALRNCERQ